MYQQIKNSFCLLLLLSIYTLSCSEKSEILKVIVENESVSLNDRIYVRIFPENQDWTVFKAFVGCDVANEQRPTLLREVFESCQKELFVENDTIFIEFFPTKAGKFDFPRIIVILENERDEHLIIKSGFSYTVLED